MSGVLGRYSVKKSSWRVTVDTLRSSARVSGYELVNLRQRGNALVGTGGAEAVCTAPVGASRILYAAGGKVILSTSNGVAVWPETKSIGLGGAAYGMGCLRDEENIAHYLFTTDMGVKCVKEQNGALTVLPIENAPQGKCIAIHRERAFVAGREYLSYTPPFRAQTWYREIQEGETGRSIFELEAGRIPLPPEGGDAVALIAYDDRLYLFREFEILRIRADSNDLNYKIEQVRCDYGAVKEGSVQVCGGKLTFFTDRGLCVWDGGELRLACSEYPALKSPLSSAAYGEKYCALAADGNLFCYDAASEKICLLTLAAEHLASGYDGIYFRHGGTVFRLNERKTIPSDLQTKFALAVEIGKRSGRERRLDGIAVEGRGTFQVGLTTDKGSMKIQADAEKRVPLPKVLPGSVLDISLSSTGDVEIKAIVLHFREEL